MYYAMKREIARENEVTSVEYVRCRMYVRHAIGRLKPIRYTRISRGRRIDRLKSRFVFRTRSDTHGCVYRKMVSSVRIFQWRSQCRRKNVRKRRKTHGKHQQEHDPYPPEGLRSPAHRQGLPTKTEIVTILRAVHKYKDSREQFERRTHKRLIDIMNPTQKTVEALMNLEVPAGVEIEIKL